MIDELDPQLKLDTHYLFDLPLCDCLLMNDKRYPWIILVPRRAQIQELYELCDSDLTQLVKEIKSISIKLTSSLTIDKLNVATLGNQVKQLHIHIIGRTHTDLAWPKPVWGVGEPIPYSASEREAFKRILNG